MRKASGTRDVVTAHFRLHKPCGNCPFRNTGALELEPGRLQGIIDLLITNDHSTFQCHVTVHGKSGGEWDDDGNYEASGQEAMCAGAMIYLEKLGRPTVAMRLGQLWGKYRPETLLAHHASVIDPEPASASNPTEPKRLCHATAR
ncbi:hypothetical protein LP417_35565 (plasmid) [Polaromonas sp. P1-6]|nr:hypothetical protein LP417_35565 [Polaromonas sp. P1-6]